MADNNVLYEEETILVEEFKKVLEIERFKELDIEVSPDSDERYIGLTIVVRRIGFNLMEVLQEIFKERELLYFITPSVIKNRLEINIFKSV